MGIAIQERELRLVDPSAPHGAARARGLIVAVCLCVVSVVAWSTWRGADPARSPLDARRHVQVTLAQALAEGNRSPGVLDGLRQLRAQLGRRPLDSKSRVQYAALLLSMTHSRSDTRAAAFHARLAADLAPVTLPVVELAALILSRSGDTEEALALVRAIFEFDATSAADLLLRLEDSLEPRQVRAALAETPEAWRAWARALAITGRSDESVALLREAAVHWPGDVALRVALARAATHAGDWDELERRVDRESAPPEGRAGVELLAFRARLHAERGRQEEARRDLRTALASGGHVPAVLLVSGDVQRRLGDVDDARETWNRALFRLSRRGDPMRITLLVRLADLEEATGRASVALRYWRDVLELDPGHVRAQARVRALTGGP